MKTIWAYIPLVLTVSASILLAEESVTTRTVETNAAGTKVVSDASRQQVVTAAGTTVTTEEVKTVVDPKGLLNAESASKRVERQASANGDFQEKSTRVHADGTTDENTTTKSSSRHLSDRGKTTKTTRTRTLDPQGLGNKTTIKTTETVVTHPDSADLKSITAEVNGKVVAEGSQIVED